MHKRLLFTAAVLTVVLLTFCRPGFGQQKAPEMLSRFLRANLNSRLIVIEGDRYVEEADRKELETILREKTTPWDRIRAIADKCDYEAKQYEGAYLLYKRYSDARELPCVSSEELVAFAEEVSQTVNTLLFANTEVKSNRTAVFSLLQSLSEPDWELIQRDVLPVKSLSAENKQALRTLFVEAYYGTLRKDSKRLSVLCRNFDDARLMLGTLNGEPRFYYQAYSGGKPGEEWSFFSPEVPPSKEAINKAIFLNASFAGTELQDILKEVNVRKSDGTVYAASKSLVHKPVSVSGLESSQPLQVLRCIAKLYDLRIASAADGGVMELARKRLPRRAGVEIGQLLASNLPYPMRRALPNRSYDPVTRLLLLPLIAAVEKEKTKSLPVRQLSSLDKVSIVVNMFEQLARSFRDPTPMPAYLSHLDTLYLKCRRNLGSSLEFAIVYEKNGSLRNGAPQFYFPRDVSRE